MDLFYFVDRAINNMLSLCFCSAGLVLVLWKPQLLVFILVSFSPASLMRAHQFTFFVQNSYVVLSSFPSVKFLWTYNTALRFFSFLYCDSSTALGSIILHCNVLCNWNDYYQVLLSSREMVAIQRPFGKSFEITHKDEKWSLKITALVPASIPNALSLLIHLFHTINWW